MSAEERIRKLEEGQVFADRAIDELSEEVRALGKRLGEAIKVLERIESRLQGLESPIEEPDEE